MTDVESAARSRHRVRRALAGQPVDRVPISFWRHFRGIDRDPILLAQATQSFFNRFGLDFVKTMPGGCYCVDDWAWEIDYCSGPDHRHYSCLW